MDKKKRIYWLKNRISSMEKARDEIPFGLIEDEEMELSAYKDSLASLTAEPSFTVLSDSSGEDQYTFGVNKCTKDGFYELYTAPPVPEIKFPDLLDIPDGLDLSSAMAALHWHKNEIKLLNGLGE